MPYVKNIFSTPNQACSGSVLYIGESYNKPLTQYFKALTQL